MNEPTVRLLILHPTPGIGRQETYYRAAEILAGQGAAAVFAYCGPRRDLAGSVPVEHFETWYAENHARVESTGLTELEERYPESNLWLGIVAERRVSNFSFLNGSYPMPRYPRADLERLAKAVVLFYQDVMERHGIQAVLAHHTDNIHSAMVWEMCRSLPVRPFLVFPDYYWEKGRYFLFDDKYFRSSKLERRYAECMERYDDLVLPRQEQIEDYVHTRATKDPKEVAKVAKNRGLRKSIQGTIAAAFRRDLPLHWKRPDIVAGYGTVHVPTSLRAFAVRLRNYLGNRLARPFHAKLPDTPFVYFPLQRVPEAAMLSRATGYLNQQGVVQAVAASLPLGYTLVVKEHPRAMVFQPPAYYQGMAEAPNVHLVEPDMSNHLLLANASLVVTIAGTLGYQQIMNGKPVIMFGTKFYSPLEGAIKTCDLNGLPYLLKDILLRGAAPVREDIGRSVRAFVAAILDVQYSSPADNTRLHKDPEAFATLVGEMIRREIAPAVHSA